MLTTERGLVVVFMDYWIPNRLVEIRDEMVSQYMQDNNHHHLKPKQRELLTNAVSCLAYNISHCVATGENTFTATLNSKHFSEPIIYNGNEVKRRVSYVWFKNVFTWLQSEQLIYVDMGGVEGFKSVSGRVVPANTRNTLVRVSKELVELFKPISSNSHIEILKNVLVLRDEGGKDSSFKLKDYHIRLIELLNLYNTALKGTEITLGDEKFFIQGRKVYNESFNRGGRCYITGAKIMSHLLKKENRNNIKINGKGTVEVDMCALHPSMIAEIEGVRLPEGFDPYSLDLPGYDPDTLRNIAKIALLVLINSNSPRQASLALSMEAYRKLPLDELKRLGKLPDPIGSKLIIREVMERNQYAAKWLGEGRGLELQWMDSRIMDYVIDKCLESGIVTIPLHDGCVVQKEYSQRVAKFMEEGYNEVLGSKMNFKVKVGG